MKSQKKKEKRKKKKKNGNVKISGSSFVQIFFPLFTPIWKDCTLKEDERKLMGPTTFLSPSPFQPNTISTHFLSYFPLFFFSILPKIHPTKHTLRFYRNN